MAVDKKALNIELLKLAGFTYTGGIWSYPDGVDVDNGVPFFPESFDECLKWILPKTHSQEIHIQPDENGWQVDIELGEYWAIAKTQALAFCLAVRKLKDAKE